MKKIIMICSAILIVFGLVGCGKTAEINKTLNSPNSVNIETLKNKYPEYFEMSDFKGIEVYVWQMSENVYRCGMMSGTNRSKSDEEIIDLQFKSLSIEEAKAILSEIGVEKDLVSIIPISLSYSSYHYEINDEYREKVNKLFD